MFHIHHTCSFPGSNLIAFNIPAGLGVQMYLTYIGTVAFPINSTYNISCVFLILRHLIPFGTSTNGAHTISSVIVAAHCGRNLLFPLNLTRFSSLLIFHENLNQIVFSVLSLSVQPFHLRNYTYPFSLPKIKL